MELVAPHSLDVSPDGKRVAFCVTSADFQDSRWISRLWLAEIDGEPARQICYSDEGESEPRWSPDGKYLAFLSARADLSQPPPADEDSEEPSEQIWLLPTNGGEAFCLTHAPDGVQTYRWAPDSKALIYLANEDRHAAIRYTESDRRRKRDDAVSLHKEIRRRELWEVGVEDRRCVPISAPDKGLHDFDLSPCGKFAVLMSNGSGEPNDYNLLDLHILNFETGDLRKLVDRPGAKVEPTWSPDGKSIAFLAPLDQAVSFSQECVWTVDIDGSNLRNLFENVPYDAHSVTWDKGGSGVYAGLSHSVHGPVTYVTKDEFLVIEATSEWLCDKPVPCPTGGFVVCAESAEHPYELYYVDASGSPKRLTELNTGWRERHRVPRTEIIHWQSDGMDIEGLLFHPDTASEDPLQTIVLAHGGPKAHACVGYSDYDMPLALAADGYLVFQPNYRGSEGYGNEFALASRGDLGGGDFRDVISGLDMLIERGLADANRLAIVGASYGGYLASWAAAQTDRFKTAISKFGMFDLAADFGASELWRWEVEYLQGYYWENRDLYARLSPASYVDRITAPILLIHGEGDDTTPFSNSRQLYNALKAMGRRVELVAYPREGHGIGEPLHRIDEARRCIAWLNEHVLGHAGTTKQMGVMAEHEGFEYQIVRCQDADGLNLPPNAPRVIELEWIVASQGPMSEGWSLRLDSISLIDSAGRRKAPIGIILDGPGGKCLVTGKSLAFHMEPNADTGRLGTGAVIAYEATDAGGDFQITIADLPPIQVNIPPAEVEPDGKREQRAKA
jgi:dipeptidyl aminopeptidase/acylaminoacyl peptidase